MSNQPTIPCIGTHYTNGPEVVFRKVKAGEAITKGNRLQWSATADDGVTVLIGTDDTITAGIALQTAASGAYLLMQTSGLGLVDLVTSNAVAAGELIHPHASTGGAVEGTAISAATTADIIGMVGLALADDSSTTQTAGTYIIMCNR